MLLTVPELSCLHMQPRILSKTKKILNCKGMQKKIFRIIKFPLSFSQFPPTYILFLFMSEPSLPQPLFVWSSQSLKHPQLLLLTLTISSLSFFFVIFILFYFFFWARRSLDNRQICFFPVNNNNHRNCRIDMRGVFFFFCFPFFNLPGFSINDYG